MHGALKGTLETILVADDEPVVLDVVARILQGAGYKVLKAGTADTALEQANGHEGAINLLVLNHCLEARPGRDLVDKIVAIHPQLKVLRFSGFMESDLRAKGEIAPESFFIQKPFGINELTAKIREVLGSPGGRITSAGVGSA